VFGKSHDGEFGTHFANYSKPLPFGFSSVER
jgi:hypothetical protein